MKLASKQSQKQSKKYTISCLSNVMKQAQSALIKGWKSQIGMKSNLTFILSVPVTPYFSFTLNNQFSSKLIFVDSTLHLGKWYG